MESKTAPGAVHLHKTPRNFGLKSNTPYPHPTITTNPPIGEDVTIVTRQRRHQDFFRSAVLASYHSVCCITGISSPKLLIASHIKPWKDSTPQERTDPQNGLCLNALHDRAFDQGLLTITTDYKIRISDALREEYTDEVGLRIFTDNFGKYENLRITFPEKLLPKREYLDYHGKMIFKS